ncbi:MAG: DUF3127 domain-containing protein [Myxococcota bacterium]
MGLQATGRIHALFDEQEVGKNKFKKRAFVVEMADNPRYPQYVEFELTGDRCPILDDFRVGDEVQIDFQLRGREWTSPKGDVKYFNSLSVWTIEKAGASADGEPPPPDDFDAPPPSDEDIPF